MSLDKAIKHGKEHRKPYTKSKAGDHSCRNHGSCAYCKHNRIFTSVKRETHAKQDISNYKKGIYTYG